MTALLLTVHHWKRISFAQQYSHLTSTEYQMVAFFFFNESRIDSSSDEMDFGAYSEGIRKQETRWLQNGKKSEEHSMVLLAYAHHYESHYKLP
ncbi:hypothetical protein CEXT_334891 [Caerostris extrusa]|uniref:Uncharacterized protein n=1 Tax=Caerostris extrusa TaxID=172846 RepID=A0AAV4YEL2_CAEEX|nr:hypothetical protein CEXT_334891 [Caerostris extrusa]